MRIQKMSTVLALLIVALMFMGADCLGGKGGGEGGGGGEATSQPAEKTEEAAEETEEAAEEEKEEAAEEKEEAAEEKAEEKEEAGEEMAGEKEEAAEEKEEVELPSRDNYIEATVKSGCINLDSKLDTAQKADKRKEILAKYGYTEETFTASIEKFKDDPTIKPIVEGRLTKANCPKELDDKVVEKVEDEEKKDSFVHGGGWKGSLRGSGATGEVMMTLRPGKLNGTIKGLRNGEKFICGFQGTTKASGQFTGSGSNKNTNIRISGKASGKKASGTITGNINGKKAVVSFSVSK